MTYAAGILYRVGNRVLLLKRGDDCDQPGTWGLPGGKAEAGETAMQAACRESMEETGFAPDDLGRLRVLEQTERFTTFGATLPQEFNPVLNSEHRGFLWAPLDQLPAPLHPGLAPLLLGMQSTTAADTTSARQYDGNGWFEVKRNPLSKAGIFPYSGAQLGITGPDADRIFQVLRPPEELADPACIESFKLIPWVNDHTMLGPNLQKVTDQAAAAEAKGVHGVVGENVFFEGGTLYGNIKAFSDSLAELINTGKRELSAGYRCVYDMVAGVFEGQHYDAVQRQIRGNHLALVKAGRMGPGVAVMDHFTFTVDAKEFIMADKETKDEASGMTLADVIKVVGEMAPQLAALNAAIAKIGTPAAPAAAAVEDKPAEGDTGGMAAELEDAKETIAAMDTSLKATVKAMDDMKANGTREFLKAVAERDDLARRLVPVVGAFDHALMTTEEVAAYGCEKLAIKAPAAAARFALDAYLQARPTVMPAAFATGMDAAVKPTSLADSIISGTK